MNTDQIFGNDHRYIHLRRKVEKIALAKKMTFAEAVIFCLKGASTPRGNRAISRKHRLFTRPEGGSTQSMGTSKEERKGA